MLTIIDIGIMDAMIGYWMSIWLPYRGNRNTDANNQSLYRGTRYMDTFIGFLFEDDSLGTINCCYFIEHCKVLVYKISVSWYHHKEHNRFAF